MSHEDEINRLANDLAGDWRERAEKAEAEVTVWKTRLVEETARLRDINQRLAAELRAENEQLRGLIRELLRFVPYEKPEQGPLPDWIVNVAERAREAAGSQA